MEGHNNVHLFLTYISLFILAKLLVMFSEEQNLLELDLEGIKNGIDFFF